MLRSFVKLFKRKCATLHSTYEPMIDSNNALEFLGMFIALSCVLHTGTHEMRRKDTNLHLKEEQIEIQTVTSTRFK